jgi:hypothetical protein
MKEREDLDKLFQSIKNVELKDARVENLSFMKQLIIICNIKNIDSDYHIGIDLNKIYSQEQIYFIIKGFIENRILEHYGLQRGV